MRMAQLTLNEPQAAFMADAVILLSAVLMRDKQAIDAATDMINKAITAEDYTQHEVTEMLGIVYTLGDRWSQPEADEPIMPFPPGGMVS